MRYGSLFIALSASFLWLAVVAGGAGLALLWPALSFALVGAAYLARQPARGSPAAEPGARGERERGGGPAPAPAAGDPAEHRAAAIS
ncbi:hypothetical protein WME97_43935 [Sorangium sp. So ce367]|uniref:hypothetical protein n=1 Tax=Sorangium sp. So ce367 TaxID=3133305 RepID=UPI003F64464E